MIKKPKIVLGNVRGKVYHLDWGAWGGMKRYLRIPNDYYARLNSEWNMPAYTYVVNWKDGVMTFPIGIADRIFTLLVQEYGADNVHVVDNRSDTDPLPDDYIIAKIRGLPIFNTIRDYQLDAILNGIHRPNGIFHMATGSGKTAILAGLIGAWGKKTLVLVNKKDLADQLVEELCFYNGYKRKDVGQMYGGKSTIGEVTVGLVQTLSRGGRSKAAKKKKQFLESVEMVIVDECHNAHAATYKKVLRKCKNASVRYGFSATPFNREIQPARYVKDRDSYVRGKLVTDRLTLEGLFGPVIYRKTTRDLIDDGWLATPRVRMVANTVYNDGEQLHWADEYDRIIVKDEERNHMICKIVKKAYDEGEQVIGFVSRIEHGEKMAKLLIESYGIPKEDFAFVSGDVSLPYDLRKKKISDFKEGGLKILFGTVLSEGLNFQPKVGINISGGLKSSVVIQRIGRVLRKPRHPDIGDVDRNDNREVFFYDFLDRGNPVFEKHGMSRRNTYEEQGHDLQVIQPEELL